MKQRRTVLGTIGAGVCIVGALAALGTLIGPFNYRSLLGELSRSSDSKVADVPAVPIFSTWEYVGPGGMGAFVDIQRFPGNDAIMFAAADVGGVNLSLDSGATWKNVSAGLGADNVQGIAFSKTSSSSSSYMVLLGTDQGIFHSQELLASELASGVSITWERSGDFGESPYTAMNVNDLTHPVLRVSVDPSDPTRVWAGIGEEVILLDNDARIPRYDAYKVYSSTDGGLNWSPSLRLSPVPVSFYGDVFTAGADDGYVHSILVHPTEGNKVWVATDHGLYYTADWGEKWKEIGIKRTRSTMDKGETWTSSATFDKCARDSTCLPIVTNADEVQPNLRDLALTVVTSINKSTNESESLDVLYAVVWDRGFESDPKNADGSKIDCDEEGFFEDSELRYFKGGVYKSTDGGSSWKRTLTTASVESSSAVTSATPMRIQYRCNDIANEYGASNFIEVEAPPTSTTENAGYLAVGGVDNGSTAGVFLNKLSTGIWTRYTTGNDDASMCPDNDCFEGHAAGAVIGKYSWMPGIGLRASWSGGTARPPNPLWLGGRGYMQGNWNSDDSRYEFDQMGANVGSVDPDTGDATSWKSTGLDDMVASKVAFDKENKVIYAASGDGALLAASYGSALSPPSEWTWSHTADAWVDELGWASVYGPDSVTVEFDQSGRLLTGVCMSGVDRECSVLRLDSTKTTWEVIGGSDHAGDADSSETNFETNGFGSKARIHDFAIDYSSTPEAERYIVTAEDGVWVFDDATSAWYQAPCYEATTDDGETTTHQSGQRIVTSSNLEYALVTVYETGTDANLDGLYAVTTSEFDASAADAGIQCKRINSPDDSTTSAKGRIIRDPIGIALAGTRLIVSSGYSKSRGTGSVLHTTDLADCITVTGPPSSSIRTCLEAPPDELTWTVAADAVAADEDTTVSDDERQAMKWFSFQAVAASPTNTNLVVAALYSITTMDYYLPQNIYVSVDGGLTFTTSDAYQAGLPIKRIRALTFDPSGTYLYAGTSASLYRVRIQDF